MLTDPGGSTQQERQDQTASPSAGSVPTRLPVQKRENVVESLAVIQFHSGEFKSMK